MKRYLTWLILLVGTVSLVSCATTEDPTQPEDPNRVSTQPWNRPQKWEGPGVLGGMMNTQ